MQTEVVIATHGYFGHRIVMFPLCQRLRRYGYRVVNWGYPSVWRSVKTHTGGLRRAVEAVEADQQVETLHLVAHSMGNILVRLLLEELQPEKLKRIVMICPPNHGSHVASRFAPWLGGISRPLRDIADTEQSLVNSLGQRIDDRYEVGIVQADWDFVVKPSSTRLPEARDYIQLPGLHASVLAKSSCAEAVHHFLQHGNFQNSVAQAIRETARFQDE